MISRTVSLADGAIYSATMVERSLDTKKSNKMAKIYLSVDSVIISLISRIAFVVDLLLRNPNWFAAAHRLSI